MVTPYFTQHSPPALVATLPPIEQISYEEGSGGYQNPAAAAALLTSAFIAPGWATATRIAGSMVMSVMRSSERTMPPSTAVDPPETPVPAPRGTTGTLSLLAQRSASWTSCVEVARTTARGMPASAWAAQSRR